MAAMKRLVQDDALPSSSPAFATPAHPVIPISARRPPPPPAFKPALPAVLPILLPPSTLRPLAFRSFTKKHNLTLSSSALQALASFIGRQCGSGWREEGTGEQVVEEVAKLWKAEAGSVIVEDGEKLKGILKTLEGCMSGGRVGPIKSALGSRQNSLTLRNDSAIDLSGDGRPSLERQGSSFGFSGLSVATTAEDEDADAGDDPHVWLKVVSASQQPRLGYDADRKHFVPITTRPTLFPSPSHQTSLFKQRYYIIHQRLLRNEAFQAPTVAAAPARLKKQVSSTAQSFYKVTTIANLLGRGGTNHLLLGMLVVAPTGTLALNDPTGSIFLDLEHAAPLQGLDSSYFCPGMIVLVDGVYEEDWAGAGSGGLGSSDGVGGTIGGRFVGFSIGGPPVEKRSVSLGIDLSNNNLGGGFGWTDFLGQGSERAVGNRMRRLEERMLGPGSTDGASGRNKIIMLGDVTLDQPATLTALRNVLDLYSPSEQKEPPMAFVIIGNFSSTPSLAGAGSGSIEYKELFNSLAAVLADFSPLLRSSSFFFVPGDNDCWSSSFSAGASTVIPKEGVPQIFTSRVRRAFATAKNEGPAKKAGEGEGEAIWTSNPSRLSLFGPQHEIVLFRDDVSGRMMRNSVRIGQALRNDQSQDKVTPAETEDTTTTGALPPVEPMTGVEDMSVDQNRSAPALPIDASDDYSTSQAKKIILSLLPQSTLSPFLPQTRPVHWDHSSALSLYPLPHTLVLCDAEAEPFALTYEGCHVLNPGRLVSGGGKRKRVRWAEYDTWRKRGVIREDWVG